MSSLTQFYYCVRALGWSDAAQIVNLIGFPQDKLPYEFLKECFTELHTLNPFSEVSGFYVSNLGRQQEALHLDGEDVLSSPSEP